MKLYLNQKEIESALVQTLKSQLPGSAYSFTFVNGRKGNGITAEVEISTEVQPVQADIFDGVETHE